MLNLICRFAMICLISLGLTESGWNTTLAAQSPNVILVMCDDLGWGDVGYNGNKTVHTPNIDAMALGGMRFNRFYAAAPVCSPTRGSAITGRHPFRYGVFSANTGHMRDGETTLAEFLGKTGYATGHFGKWHLGTLTTTEKDANRGGPKGAKHFSPPQDNGFDVCFSTESKVPTWDPMIKPPMAGNKWWDPVTDPSKEIVYGTAYWDHHGQRVTENLRGDDSRVIMDRAIPFIRSAVENEKPFFVIVWFHAPHLPVVAGPKYTEMYRDLDGYAQHFFGCITALDEQVGRLRNELRTLGVAENTLVTFCSDNGPEGSKRASADDIKGGPGSAGPFRGRKRDLYEGGIRVPGIIEWPAQIAAGSVTDFPAVTSDYLPTILDAVGAELADDRPLDGISLLPVFAGEMTERPRPIGFEAPTRVALSDNRYKLIRYNKGSREGNDQKLSHKSNQFELYDLIEDPGESQDLADKYPEIVGRMKKTLEEWRESCRRSLDGDDYE